MLLFASISHHFSGMKRKKCSGWWQAIRKEMRLECLGLDYERPSRFCKSQWHCPSLAGCVTAYLAFRCLVAVYLVTGLMLSLVDLHVLQKELKEPDIPTFRAKWFIYVTNWACLILTVQAVMAAALATYYDLTLADASMSKFHKAYWLLNNLANTCAPAITLMYWTTVYNEDKHQIDFCNVHGHIMNSVLVVADLMVTAHPVRLLHFVHPMALAVIYTLFSFAYFSAGGTNRYGSTSIYPFLNWDKPLMAIIYVTCACILLMVVHTLMWLFYQLRRFVALQLGTLRPGDEPPFTTATCVKVNSVLPIDLEKLSALEKY